MSDISTSHRFHALDQARATAMLLGVFYHALLFGGMLGGSPPVGLDPTGGPGGFNTAMMFQEWLHSFRMPLFFLISGFFCRMMFQKHGIRIYLYRRWSRIGMPLLIGVFTFVPLYQFASESFRSGPPGGPIGSTGRPGSFAPGGFNLDDLPAPPPGFVPPPLQQFDANQDGTIDEAEWKVARKNLPPPPPGFGPPGFGQQGRDRDEDLHPAAEPPGPIFPGIRPGGRHRPRGMFSPPGEVSTRLFGPFVNFFTLSHLWFLWYLLIFVTAAPFVAQLLVRIIGEQSTGSDLSKSPGDCDVSSAGSSIDVDRVTADITRWQLVPLIIGLLSLPALLATDSPFGWSLGLVAGIGRAFPDFLWHLEIDMPYYFIFFLSGWWLHRMKVLLPAVASGWWMNFAVGFAAYWAATTLSRTYAMQTQSPNYSLIRLMGYFLSGAGSAYTAWAFLGAFLRFANRSSVAGRYLADTAFWVYLLHQALLFPFLAWLAPFKLTWWINGGLAGLMTVAASLLLYESFVRPTALNQLFGPGASSRWKSFQSEELADA
jgi:fucose 4-O-acetylase-like acetyltransferase